MTEKDQPESTRTHRILVVDDDPAIRNLVANFLKMRGYGAEAVETGEAALEALNRKKFHLMILDSRLPGLSGDDVIEQLKKMPKDRRPRVVLVTGRITARIHAGDKEVEVVDVLRKPFDLKDLDHVVLVGLGLPTKQ